MDPDIVELATGSLTKDQLKLVIEAIPLDVTYVDEHDVVRYYSEGYRLFSRTPEVIGTDVVECHSPASQPRVAQLISELKSGWRDSADFLEQVKCRTVHIRYLALRDAAGEYRGILEVAQDVADVGPLEGPTPPTD